MIGSKLKEVMICVRGGIVTAPYPLGPAPSPVPAGFRGRVEVDVDKCVGCGGCANVCPPRAFVVRDVSQELRVIELYRERCTYCARCEEVCQERAIRLTLDFESATDDRSDLNDQMEIRMSTCQRCGRCFKPKTPLDRLMVTGFRDGDGKSEACGSTSSP